MQVGVKVEHRAAQGHHRQAYVSRCVSGYARDDVLPQLQCQEAILRALLGGWEPIVPLQRGVARRAMSKWNAVPAMQVMLNRKRARYG